MRSVGATRSRLSGLAILVLLSPLFCNDAVWAQVPGPNIIVINSDDYAWPYYGFMQRYLEAKQQAGEHGRSYAVDTKFGAVKPADRSHRFGLLLPDDDDPDTPPLHKILTPALDSLAGGTAGQYFPVGHIGGSMCQPSMVSILSGLHVTDIARRGSDWQDEYTASPVIPEWLIGFQWDPSGTRFPKVIEEQQIHYLTMAAGKWTYDPDTQVFHGDTTTQPPRKNPWDRELQTGGDSDGARDILKNPQLQDIKDLIGCARCRDFVCVNEPTRECTPGGQECNPTGEANCWPKGCIAPDMDYRPDSSRIANWVSKCTLNPDRVPRSFFVFYGPHMPHLTFDESICHGFDRGFDTNGGANLGLCSESRYEDRSAYCNGSGNVFASTRDPDLNRCQPSEGAACCPGGGVGTAPLAACTGSPCTIDADCEGDQVCRAVNLSCDCFANILEEIGDNIQASPDPDISAKNVYTAENERFEKKANYLRFINAFDRTVDEILVHLKAEGLDQNTLVLVLTDNGAEDPYLPKSKGFFTEHAYRTPFILYDPTSSAPPPPQGCAGRAGCRNEFVQFTDLLATIRDAQEVLFEALGHVFGPNDPFLPNPSPPSPPPLRQVRNPAAPDAYAEGGTLRPVSSPMPIDRACRFPSDDGLPESHDNYFPDPPNKIDFKQCLFGMKTGQQGTLPNGAQGASAKDGWYVLAEMMDSNNRPHLCKFYHRASNPGDANEDLHDLVCDPNERVDLVAPAAHYPAGYCRMRHCVDDGNIVGPGCADRGICGGGKCVSLLCRGGPSNGLACATNGDCGPQCEIVCVGGAMEGTACSTDGQCPGGACGPDLAGTNLTTTDEYCKRHMTTLRNLLYYTAAKREWLVTGNAVQSDWSDHPYN
jgi:hypothetical protein